MLIKNRIAIVSILAFIAAAAITAVFVFNRNASSYYDHEKVDPSILATISVDTIGANIPFIRYSKPITTPSKLGMVDIIEFFWYGSPTSNAAQHYFNLFKNEFYDKPVNVQLIPLQNNQIWDLQARAFYTNQVLGLLPTAHVETFHDIHQRNVQLNDANIIINHFSRVYGVNTFEYRKMFESEQVTHLMTHAKNIIDMGKISGQMFVVNGQFAVNHKISGSIPNMFVALKKLTERELGKLRLMP